MSWPERERVLNSYNYIFIENDLRLRCFLENLDYTYHVRGTCYSVQVSLTNTKVLTGTPNVLNRFPL